jgi:hypothetical protein
LTTRCLRHSFATFLTNGGMSLMGIHWQVPLRSRRDFLR